MRRRFSRCGSRRLRSSQLHARIRAIISRWWLHKCKKSYFSYSEAILTRISSIIKMRDCCILGGFYFRTHCAKSRVALYLDRSIDSLITIPLERRRSEAPIISVSYDSYATDRGNVNRKQSLARPMKRSSERSRRYREREMKLQDWD